MDRKKGIDILLEKHNRIVNYIPESSRSVRGSRYGMNPRLEEAEDEELDQNDELDFDMGDEGQPENPEAMDDTEGMAEPPDPGMDLGGEEGDLDSLEFGDALAGGDDMGSYEDNLLPGETDGEMDDFGGEPEDEIDVTEFVEKSQDLADKVDSQVSALNQQLDALTSKISSMDSILAKIEKVEDEIHAMKPQKPIETLKLRSLDSYPYSQGIDDYWKRKEIEIEKLRNHNLENESNEYVLTPEDVENYSDVEIKRSFNPGSEPQRDFDRYQSNERNMGRNHGIQ